MTNWEKIRCDFPVAKKLAYFISAGMSPIPNQVLSHIIKKYEELNEYGDIHWQADLQNYHELRKKIGAMINATAEDLAFVGNTSTGMSILAITLKNNLSGHFNVVSMIDEFPSSTVPFEYQGIEMRYVEPQNARYSLNSILNQVDEKTVAVVTSYVQYCTGFRQDLEALGKELKKRNILFFVNATQGFPIFPIDVQKMNISAMTVTFLKWGFCGHVGSLFYTTPEFRNKYRSPFAGWLSVQPESGELVYTKKNQPFELYKSADRYVFGGFNLQSIEALDASLDYLKNLGSENIRNRIYELTDYLISGLKKSDLQIVSPVENTEERSAIVVINLGEKTEACISYLEKNSIHTSYRNGNMRIAVNIFNNREDIDRLLREIKNYQRISA